jgi:ligand-binding sensor domain-containing protein
MIIPILKNRKVFLLLAAMVMQIGISFSNIIKVEHVLKDSEISEGYILSICKDSYGFIWLGTYSGVFRYD